VSIDPRGPFGPLGKYGAYGKVGSVINLVFCITMVSVGTIVIFTTALPSGMPVWFAVGWIAVGTFLVWRFALIARSVRRRERESAESHSQTTDDSQ